MMFWPSLVTFQLRSSNLLQIIINSNFIHQLVSAQYRKWIDNASELENYINTIDNMKSLWVMQLSEFIRKEIWHYQFHLSYHKFKSTIQQQFSSDGRTITIKAMKCEETTTVVFTDYSKALDTTGYKNLKHQMP